MSEENKTVLVPDGLDLVERAKLGLNGLIGTCDPDVYYEPYFLAFFGARPAYFIHYGSQPSGVQPKYLEALALMKCMTDSPDTESEKGFIKAIMDNIEEDGFLYDRKDPKRPWNVGVGYGVPSWDDDYANIAGNGRLVNGMYYFYQLTGDEMWKRAMKRNAEKLYDVAVQRNGYAFYPDSKCGNDFSWVKSGWPNTDEPKGPQDGGEGCSIFYQANTIRGLMKWYFVSGDERMVALSKKICNFVIQPQFYGGVVDIDPQYGAKRAHFWGHTHGNLATLRSMLDYAIVTNNQEVLEFCRDGYEWIRHSICPQLAQHLEWEGCCTGDYPALGIQLSDAGMGDYWDDVDYAIRNASAQCQVTDLDAIRKVGEYFAERPINARFGAPKDWRFERCIGLDVIPGLECVDNVLERSIGGFANSLYDGKFQSAHEMSCCTANGLQAFYYAWEAAARHDSGTSTINLLFTRFAPWLDVISHMPYEGKVEILNKTSLVISIRIPGWVKLGDLKCTVNGNPAKPIFSGRYAVFTHLSANEKIVLEFPLYRRKMTLAIPHLNQRGYRGYPTVNVEFSGSTCIRQFDEGEDVFGSNKVWVKQFNNPKYCSGQLVTKEIPYHVPQRNIRWY